ncbi:MAG: SEC59/DGK1/VTE5 family protein [Candidatus Aenigmatarchaeota archaeon]|nr:SEC59/DGK1/VTE5 family protein [Candidatus Aenigmarchaeota archaeon]
MNEIKRQLVHGSGIIFSIMVILNRELAFFISFFTIIFLFLFAYFRTFIRKNKKIEKFIKDYERKEEAKFPFKGALYFFFSISLSIILFPKNIASASIAVLSISDMLSTLVGIKYGKHKFYVNKYKSLEGSIIFFISCLLILLFYTNFYNALLISIITTCIEVFPYVNDNISIPLTVGFLMIML